MPEQWKLLKNKVCWGDFISIHFLCLMPLKRDILMESASVTPNICCGDLRHIVFVIVTSSGINISNLLWEVEHNKLFCWFPTQMSSSIYGVTPGKTVVWGGPVERDERVNQGEGACTGAYSIKPPQERTTRTACVSLKAVV